MMAVHDPHAIRHSALSIAWHGTVHAFYSMHMLSNNSFTLQAGHEPRTWVCHLLNFFLRTVLASPLSMAMAGLGLVYPSSLQSSLPPSMSTPKTVAST